MCTFLRTSCTSLHLSVHYCELPRTSTPPYTFLRTPMHSYVYFSKHSCKILRTPKYTVLSLHPYARFSTLLHPPAHSRKNAALFVLNSYKKVGPGMPARTGTPGLTFL